MWYARAHHSRELAPLSESPRWQLVDDEHIDAVQAVEQSIKMKSFSSPLRCLTWETQYRTTMTRISYTTGDW